MMVIMRRHPDRPMTLAVGPVSCLQIVATVWVMGAQLDVSAPEVVLLTGFGVVHAAAAVLLAEGVLRIRAAVDPPIALPKHQDGSTSAASRLRFITCTVTTTTPRIRPTLLTTGSGQSRQTPAAHISSRPVQFIAHGCASRNQAAGNSRSTLISLACFIACARS